MNAKLKALRERMARTGTDLVALGPGAHMRWLAGFVPHADERPCLMLVASKREAILMPALNAEGSRAQTDVDFFEWDDAAGPVVALRSALHAIGAIDCRSVALDETMRADFALLLLDQLPECTHKFCDLTVGHLRERKSEPEKVILRKNAEIADRALEAGIAAIAPGRSESDIASVINEAFRSQSAEPVFNIVGTGANGAHPHHQTGNTVISEGDGIVIDIGATTGGYVSDITRVAIVGNAPEAFDHVHANVESAFCAALEAARPGRRASEVDKAARGVIADAGFGEYFVHRTGHGLGIEVHEPPYIHDKSDTILEPGMVFSIEPGIYLQGQFGIRLEDIVILNDDGPEILSGLSRAARFINI